MLQNAKDDDGEIEFFYWAETTKQSDSMKNNDFEISMKFYKQFQTMKISSFFLSKTFSDEGCYLGFHSSIHRPIVRQYARA